MATQNSRLAGPWRDPWVWAVLLVALTVRFLYLADLRLTPFFAHPQMDALYHDQWARRLAGGDWWGHAVFFRAPLYPYFLGVLYALFGPDYLLVRVIQLVLGAVTAGLTVTLTRRPLGRVGATAAGFLVALHGPLIYFEGELLLVVLEAPFYLLTAWALFRAAAGPRWRRWALAGVLLGLGALVRPTLLAVAPVAGFYALLRFRGRWWRPMAALAGAVLLVVAPALIRNYAVGRDVVPIASQGGLNFYLGNNPAADGMAAVAPEFRRTWTGGVDDARRLAELDRGRPLRPSEVSRYWLGRSLGWIRSHPGAAALLDLKKLRVFWNAFEVPNNQDYYFFSRLTRIFRSGLLSTFGVLGPLALAGLLFGRRRLDFGWIAVPAVLMLVIVAFFVCGRFRAPLVPLFAVWAGAGVAAVVDGIRARRWGRLAAYALVLAAAAGAVNADSLHLRARYSPSESHLRLGIFYAARGEDARARREYEAAVAADPAFPDGWNNLGVLHAQHHRLRQAEEAFRTALAISPDHAKALGNLAALDFQEGHRAEADSLARKTLAVAAGEPDALYNAAVVLGNLGDAAAALSGFRGILRLDPGNAAARVGEAKALIVLGRRDDARRTLEAHPEARRSPELREMLKNLEGS